ncbi:MAG: hypothetical protein FWD47_13965 [Treponema sp.]|nr:hypothetical protein [Treponema sp.]
MKFYEIDNALQEAVTAAEKPVRLKIEIELGGHFQSVFEQDIIEANFYSLKEAAGGVSSRGEVLIDNSCGFFAENLHPCRFSAGSFCNAKTPAKALDTAASMPRGYGSGLQVKVSFSIGEGLPYFQRFLFFVDEKGIQEIKGSGRKKIVRLDLRDLSARLKKTDEARDWTSPAVFTYSVVCDKTLPEKSLVHGIAKRAGLEVSDIDCSTIPVTLPFIRLRRNIWAELSSLTTTYRCHLECAPEKPLVFAHSPYQVEPLAENEFSHTFYGNEIFYLRKIERAELYRNTVRLKINMPVSLEKQEIWRYDDLPIFYDDNLQAYYPFKSGLFREIENGLYEAKYKIIDTNGKERNVVYADEIDDREEADNRLEFDGGAFYYSFYDVTTNYDRASLTLHKDNEGDLYKAVIHGRPIVLDLNRSCFLRDEDEITNYGTAALNVTGAYFSEYEIDGVPQYEDWVIRELAERIQNKREFTIKTHKAIFNSRVGAKVKIEMSNEKLSGTINALSYRYKRDRAFVASFRITEGVNNEI